MPRSDFDEQFRKPRREWTKRKHQLLDRYVTPASMKMRKIRNQIVLVDGFAGANAYGNETIGSTFIMVKAAEKVLELGQQATVYACEPAAHRYDQMCHQLRTYIDRDILRPLNLTHAEALASIQKDISEAPAIVFLDPQAVTQLTLDSDILPWARRQRTDILGVFMAGHACRCVGKMLKDHKEQHVHPSRYLGNKWSEGVTEQGAYDQFFEALGEFKSYKGIYSLRKQDSQRYAYGIFGLSDHHDGFWLLSSAVAKDFGQLRDFDFNVRKTFDLFAGVDLENQQIDEFNYLVDIVEPVVRRVPELSGSKLATYLIRTGIKVDELFGRFDEQAYTMAARHVRKEMG